MYLDGVHVVAEEALHLGQRRGLDVPDAGQIRLAVGRTRCSSQQIGLAVTGSWHPRSGIVDPLRVQVMAHSHEQRADQEPSQHAKS
jgi:hypothetical protein